VKSATAAALLVAAAAALAACKSNAASPPPPYDYRPFLAHVPKSILVLPPIDDTHEVGASCSLLTTVTRPLAERGYYVFPVAVVDEFMRDNGCPEPSDMHAVPLAKLDEVFGADAVMYLAVKQWGTVYQILNSKTEVTVHARLVDVRSGQEIWAGDGTASRDTSSGGGGGGDPLGQLVVMAVAAVANQIATSVTDPSHDLAPVACSSLVVHSRQPLPLGPRAAGFEDDQRRLRTTGGAAAGDVSGR
jgi:hypothetical protein